MGSTRSPDPGGWRPPRGTGVSAVIPARSSARGLLGGGPGLAWPSNLLSVRDHRAVPKPRHPGFAPGLGELPPPMREWSQRPPTPDHTPGGARLQLPAPGAIPLPARTSSSPPAQVRRVPTPWNQAEGPPSRWVCSVDESREGRLARLRSITSVVRADQAPDSPGWLPHRHEAPDPGPASAASPGAGSPRPTRPDHRRRGPPRSAGSAGGALHPTAGQGTPKQGQHPPRSPRENPRTPPSNPTPLLNPAACHHWLLPGVQRWG